MNKSFLYELSDGWIIDIQEYYYSKPLAKEDDSCIDYAVEYINKFIIKLTNYRIEIYISDTYIEPEYTIGDLVMMLNANRDYIKYMEEEIFIELVKNSISNEEKNKEYKIKFKVEEV